MEQIPTAFSIVKEAIRLRKAGEPESALSLLKSSTEFFGEGDWANYHTAVGDCHLEMRNFPEADRAYQHALHHDSSHKFAHVSFARSLSSQRRFPEAEMHMREILRNHPQDAISLSYLAILLAKMARLDEAKDYAAQSKAIDPDHPLVQKNLSIFDREAGRRGYQGPTAVEKSRIRPIPGAPVFSSPLLTKRKNPPAAPSNTANVSLAKISPPESSKHETREDIEQRLLIEPKNIGLMKRLADLYVGEKKLDAAREILTRLLSIDRVNRPAQDLLKKLGPREEKLTAPSLPIPEQPPQPEMVEVDQLEFVISLDGKPLCRVALQFEGTLEDHFRLAVTSHMPGKFSRATETALTERPAQHAALPSFLIKIPS